MRIIKGIIAVLFIYVLYVVISCMVEPLITRNTEYEVLETFQSLMQQQAEAEERILCIEDNEEALLWRLRLIELAEKEIIISTFDFNDDNSGLDIMSALYSAAERGVKVKIIVDGISGQMDFCLSPRMQALAGNDNIEVKLYNPVNWLKPWKANYRLHDKYLIVDDFAYILGGRNTTDLFLGDYRERYNIDRDILVYEQDTAVENSLLELRAYFESVWTSKDCMDFSGKQGETEHSAAFAAHYEQLRIMYPEILSIIDWNEETYPVNRITLLTNGIEAGSKSPQLWGYLNWFMKQGKDIIVQTPYIICDKWMYRALSEICSEGRRIQIITNAVESGANPFGCTDYLNQKENILKTGAEVWEALYGQSLHTKTVLVDQNVSIVGSFNFDMRSVYLDTELMLMIDSPRLNAQLREQALNQMEYSLHVLADASETPGAEYVPVELGWSKKVYYTLLQIVMIPFRHLL